MTNHVLESALLAGALSMLAAIAQAAPACSPWLLQADGSYWQRCINDDMSVHCWRASDNTGSNAVEIKC